MLKVIILHTSKVKYLIKTWEGLTIFALKILKVASVFLPCAFNGLLFCLGRNDVAFYHLFIIIFLLPLYETRQRHKKTPTKIFTALRNLNFRTSQNLVWLFF